jgi:chromosomal replication initiator protein
VDNDRLRLFAPNRFVLDWTRQHYAGRLLDLCRTYSEVTIGQISFEVGGRGEGKRAASLHELGTATDGDEDIAARRASANLECRLYL